MDNIEKVLERGEKIELLVDKTDNLRFQVRSASYGRVAAAAASWPDAEHRCKPAGVLQRALIAAVAAQSLIVDACTMLPLPASQPCALPCTGGLPTLHASPCPQVLPPPLPHPTHLQADKFHKTGRQLRSRMWWQNMKMKLIVVFILILIAVIIFCAVCFSGGKRCF